MIQIISYTLVVVGIVLFIAGFIFSTMCIVSLFKSNFEATRKNSLYGMISSISLMFSYLIFNKMEMFGLFAFLAVFSYIVMKSKEQTEGNENPTLV